MRAARVEETHHSSSSCSSMQTSNNENVSFPSSSVRSIEVSERFSTQGTSIQLCKSQDDDVEYDETWRGYVSGDFATGKLRDLTTSGCYTMAYHDALPYFVVGLSQGFAVYEASQYSLVCQRSFAGMVSTVCWLCLPSERASLLGVASLEGKVALYRVDFDILESQGPTLLHEFKVDGQVRAMSLCLFGKLDPTILLACGTKNGSLVISSYTRDCQFIQTDEVTREVSPILGLAVLEDKGHICWSTKSGRVYVYQLRRDLLQSVLLDRQLWSTERSGPVRCVTFDSNGHHLVFGGYDKTVVLVNTNLWQICRELQVHGTVNTLSFDPQSIFLTVGSRDKTFRVFDTSTYANIKTFNTPGWVTSISWSPSRGESHMKVAAVRSERTTISFLNLTPIRLSDVRLSSRHGDHSSLSWSCDGRYLARTRGQMVVVADSLEGFRDVASIELHGFVAKIAFCPSTSSDKTGLTLLAAIDTTGYVSVMKLHANMSSCCLELLRSNLVEENMKALAWSLDSSYMAVGGRGRVIHLLSSDDLTPLRQPIQVGARVWDIQFLRPHGNLDHHLAVALGDYTAVVLDKEYQPCLQITRTRTARCIVFHHKLPFLVTGDGAGTVAVADINREEIIHEINVKERVNSVAFSPKGDFLVVGTDDCKFTFFETQNFLCLQVIHTTGFALSAQFSPTGMYLALGSASESFALVSLGPFLSISLSPLNTNGSDSFKEVLYRSDSSGHSFIQRQMIEGGSQGLKRVAETLRLYPDVVYTYNRMSNEGCFDTVLRLKRPSLMKLVVGLFVDGSLDKSQDGQKSILTTNIPERARECLFDFAVNFPPDFIVEVLRKTTFMKVPFTSPYLVAKNVRRDQLRCSSSLYVDPWSGRFQKDTKTSTHFESSEGSILTPAVLPLPGMGDLSFLAALLAYPDAFDNDAMGLVLDVMWRRVARPYFIVDAFLYSVLYAFWVTLVELQMKSEQTDIKTIYSLALIVVVLNTAFLLKEVIQSGWGQRPQYFKDGLNYVDVCAILCLYGYIASMMMADSVDLTPLAVVTTILATLKLLSYLRGFSETGWLISVLVANCSDVRGFLIVLFVILLAFTVSFRLLLGASDPGFESLRRSFLSTFEMTIIGAYDPAVLYSRKHPALTAIVFILAVTCVLVVALNALISILGDSFARVQESAVSNRRRERAALIVEYLTLLPSWYRKRIEEKTQWFHVLLEANSDGDLLVDKDDWEGGINALRKDMEEMEQRQQRAIDKARDGIDSELLEFKKEVMTLLADVAQDLKKLHEMQSEGVTFSGKNVAKAVKAVKSIQKKGGLLFSPKKDH